MTAVQGKRTRVDVVYDDLRGSILSGRLLPGRRLKFTELSSEHSASMSVLREALTRLTAEGLVTNEPNLGYAVTDLSPTHLEELTEARLELEGLVFGRAIACGDLTWESNVVAAHHILEGTPFLSSTDPQRVTDAWALAHAEFHRALLAGCPNSRLTTMACRLRDEAELYRLWSRPLGSEKDRDLLAEHRLLVDRALARDVDGGMTALRAHIAHTTELLTTGFLAQNAPVAPVADSPMTGLPGAEDTGFEG